MYGYNRKKGIRNYSKSFGLNYWKNRVLLMMMVTVCDSIKFGVTEGEQITFGQVKFEMPIKHYGEMLNRKLNVRLWTSGQGTRLVM